MRGPLARLSRRQLVIAAAAAVVGVIVIVVLVIVLSSDAPPPATIESAVESVRQQDQQEAAQSERQSDTATSEAEAASQTEQQSDATADQQSSGPQQAVSAAAEEDSDGETSSASDEDSAASGYGDDYGSTTEDATRQSEPEQEQSAQAEQQAQQQAAASVAAPTSLADLAGTWTLSERGESFVGYRIGEELANIGTATAVGRTGEITATLEFDGAAITSVTIEADLRTLRSDQSFRDSALRTRGLETDTYPFATFTLTEPIAIADLPAADEPVSIDCVQGTLDLHGVTNEVCIALEGQLLDGELVVVVGSTEIALADYEIEPPTGFRVLSIEEVGLMEFQIVFERAQ